MIVIKKIAFWGFILIILSSMIFFLNMYSKNKKRDKIKETVDTDKNITLNIVPSSISITKTGNPVRKKNITSPEDINKIVSFIKSIELNEKLSDVYKGYSYSIRIIDKNGNEVQNIAIFGNKISLPGNSFYTIDEDVSEKIETIYNELNYPEVDPY